MTLDEPLYRPVPPLRVEPADARAEAIDDGLWRLRVPLAYARAPSVNAYALSLDDGFALVDCGSSLPPGWEGLAAALSLAGLDPRDLRLLVATHHHSDHAGLAAEVIARTGCEFAHFDGPATLTEPLRELDRPAAERRALGLEQGIPEWLVDRWIGNHVGGDGATPIPPGDRLLHPGDVVVTRCASWVVHHAPGHCASQLVLHDPAHGRVISADVVLHAPLPYVEWRHRPDAFGDHLASIEDVGRLDARLLLPGHGRPLDDVPGAVSYATEAAGRLRDDVRKLLRAGPATPFAIAHRYAAATEDFDALQFAMSSILAVLDHLELAGEVVSESDSAGVRVVRSA